MFGVRKHIFGVAAIAFALVLLYFGAALVVFDTRRPAYAYDEEIHNGKEVALGPRPHRWACKPTYHGIHFDGSEWPFRVFKPICAIWRLANGYASPAHVRKE